MRVCLYILKAKSENAPIITDKGKLMTTPGKKSSSSASDEISSEDVEISQQKSSI